MNPMRLLRIPEPFDHPDFLYELKLDGFRGMAIVECGRCRLFSRNGYEFKKWPALAAAIAKSIDCRSAVIDGEIACLARNGRPDFYSLMFRRKAPHFCAFDVLEIDGKDLRAMPLYKRKQRLEALIPAGDSWVRYVDHIAATGSKLFRAACRRDLEGIVAKWAHGTYQAGPGTSWLKIKNQNYSQMEGRHELFESRRSAYEGRIGRRNIAPPALLLR